MGGGALLLAFGRRIFWLFVAVIGFFAGYQFTAMYLKLSPEWLVFAIAILIGLLGAVLAYFLEKVAIGTAGFFVGAYLGLRLLEIITGVQGWGWLIILIAGVIGAILMYVVFDWALIILSSMAGASLVVEGLGLIGTVAIIVGLVLFIVGVLFQSQLVRRRETSRHTTNPSA